ncbi:MAG: ImmA/IrrE family metallo-endopeptidase [Chlamydiae bacterium]|nr:ImmA/IrrE family metallo-endopeptidase [Chlamydiota bacterium]
MDKAFIASRIREERERCSLRQEDVAKFMGWDSSKHSIVVDLEAGKRDIKAWELYKLAQLFHIKVEDFFKKSTLNRPLVLWRKKPITATALELKEREFIQKCEDYTFLEEALGEKLPIKRTLPKYTFNIESVDKVRANELACTLREELNLGDFPANTLAKVLEENYGVRFLSLSLGKDGSAACAVCNFGPAILLNEDEVPWRQTFSIAHELFHIVTWDSELLKKIISDSDIYKKNEQLADAFAAGLLMPENSLRQQIRCLCENGKLKYSTIIAIASEYRVSVEALLYRLEYLGLINQKLVEKTLKDATFRSLNKKSLQKAHEKAIQVGDRFIRIAYLAYQFNKISRSRLARLLRVSLAALEHYLNSHGFVEIDDEEIMLSNP